jgi:hypothetical protein
MYHLHKNAIMKKSIIFILATCILIGAKAQNPTVIEKSAPKSNNTLPSSGTLGSNSGVNPAGNPGTIINYSSNSAAQNNKLAPNPNIEPGTFLTSSPQGSIIITPVAKANATTQTSSIPVTEAVVKTSPKDTTNNSISKPSPVKRKEIIVTEKPVTVTDGAKPIPAYTVLLGNYVSKDIITKIKAKYGNTLYDVRAVKIASTREIAYMVRLLNNGELVTEMYYDEQ